MKNYYKFGFAGKENDSDELRRLKKLIFIIALTCSICGVVWGGMFFFLFGLVPVVFLPISFFFIVGTAIFVGHIKTNYKILVYAQMFCITWIGALIQWSLGTVHESGAVLIWTFLGPIGALIFLGRRSVLLWMGMFISILVITVVFEPFLPSQRLDISTTTIRFFYIMNIGIALTVVLLGSYYFLQSVETEKYKTSTILAKTERLNKSITDSIVYAKRLQMALLPTDKLINEVIPDSFIFYKPKDIVSGDFYWVSHVKNNKIFGAIDCTGHGVPGAMVSVICNGALNRSVNELGLVKPNEILNKSRDIIIQEFDKSDEDVKDGMDIALCYIDGYKLEFAGAHNPLWIVRNGELIEIKGDRQGVGKYEGSKLFTNHNFDLEKRDVIYIFTDGYRDQFGGAKRKRIKNTGFKKLILEIHQKPMSEQKDLLDSYLTQWQGELTQIDDICVMGVRIN